MKKYVAAFATSIMIAGASFMTVSAESYEVKKGDSLWSIADEFNMNAQELADINDLNTTTIQPNQELEIDNDNDEYIVEKGDTLSKISKKHDVSVSDLKEWNQLDSHLIVVGQELKIKEGAKSSSETKQTANKQEKSSQQKSAKSKDEDQSKSSKSTESNSEAPEGETISVSATAYTANCNGCSGVTSTGVDLNANPNEKVIAVDSSVIPLGTKVYVEGYGYATAADTGGAINGNKIDVHVPTQAEAQSWGIRTVDVTIVE